MLVQILYGESIRDVKFLLNAAGRQGSRVWPAVAGSTAGAVCRDPPARDDDRDAFSAGIGSGTGVCTLGGHDQRPDTKHARNLAKRFRKHGEAYFRFITTPGIEPTNNLAEQAMRFVVIDRQITQGTRSEKGRRWCERIWTVIATCTQQGRSVFQFLLDSIQAYLAVPSAIPPAVRPLTRHASGLLSAQGSRLCDHTH